MNGEQRNSPNANMRSLKGFQSNKASFRFLFLCYTSNQFLLTQMLTSVFTISAFFLSVIRTIFLPLALLQDLLFTLPDAN